MPTNRLLTLKISAIASPWPLLLLYSWSSSARKASIRPFIFFLM